jgi:uncharacterized protein (TIGR02996 family)
MTHHDAFLHSIIESPEDDAPRLIYADWLEERGDPRRAEFIRLQCRLAGMAEGDPARADLLDREWELLTVYRQRWQPQATSVLAKYPFGSAFLRGFLARLNLPAAVLLENGDELFRTYPLEELRIRDVGGQLAEIARRPWLACVTSLNLSHNRLTRDDWEGLLDSPHLTQLRRLEIRSGCLDPERVERLTRWPGLRRLTHFSLDHYIDQDRPDLTNRLPPGWLPRLTPQLEHLTSLHLNDTPLTEADVAQLAGAPELASLTHLRLVSCGLTPTGAQVLGRASGLPALRNLAVGWNSFGDAGNAALLREPLLARLDTLDLSTTHFGPRAAAALAESPHLGRLRCLDLTQCHLGPGEAQVLATARFGALTELRLFNDKIGPKGMAALARSSHLAGLTHLDLLDNKIGPEGT